jgi:hypothetical protein
MGTSSAKQLENVIEDYLVSEVKALGGLALKLEVRSQKGWPDRLVVLQGRVLFVECKRPRGGRTSRHQRSCITRLKKLGADARVVSTMEGVDNILKGAG